MRLRLLHTIVRPFRTTQGQCQCREHEGSVQELGEWVRPSHEGERYAWEEAQDCRRCWGWIRRQEGWLSSPRTHPVRNWEHFNWLSSHVVFTNNVLLATLWYVLVFILPFNVPINWDKNKKYILSGNLYFNCSRKLWTKILGMKICEPMNEDLWSGG